jgi:hypothetical protein
LASKKGGNSQSVMRVPARCASLASLSRSNSSRSRIEKPIVAALTIARVRSTSRARAYHGTAALQRSVSSRTERPGSRSEGIDPTSSQVHSKVSPVIMRLPRST